MKKKSLLAVIVLMLMLTAACSGGGGGGGASNGGQNSGDGQVTLRIAWWGSDKRSEYTQQVIDLYKQKNPNVKIDVEYALFDDYWKKLAPQAAANQLPDIIQMDVSYITQYAKNGQLEDLGPYLNQSIQLGDVAENVLKTGVIEGKQYGVPTGVNVLGLHYDPALLKETGLEIPENWTWEQYKELTKQAGAKGVHFDSGMQADIFFNYFLRTKGLSLYNAEGNALGYDDDQLFVEFFGGLADSIKSGGTPSPEITNQIKGILEENQIVKGKAIGEWQWSNQFVALQQVADKPMELAPMFGPDMEKGIYMQPSMYWSIASSSKVKEEAAKFIDFFLNDVEANKLIKGERGVPISGAIKEAIAPELSEPTQQVFDYVAAMEPKASPMSPPPPVGSPEVIATLTDYVEQINFGQMTPEDAAAQFRADANSILSNNM
ncbi:sugar ABC transporter substrate-binding protein [Paenibacillus sp. P96]|uniref:Sugar ABC transporter substrate-binding protein n=1 Tax=Paenibacillus zeirhizosphaerae TaxID=2987519 RepID=A0ABT9FUD1_9BACL|nr:sugar ABC transporter substrate-binding protein [Paenibacillus sp. P96]MDP4098305.1 sugar ABC transporter substrate-binding protein [Paenibacillus sp. P96]